MLVTEYYMIDTIIYHQRNVYVRLSYKPSIDTERPKVPGWHYSGYDTIVGRSQHI